MRDEVRQQLAMQLIKDASRPVYEISYLVGYNDPNAFYKAFKRWTGDYRHNLHPVSVRADAGVAID